MILREQQLTMSIDNVQHSIWPTQTQTRHMKPHSDEHWSAPSMRKFFDLCDFLSLWRAGNHLILRDCLSRPETTEEQNKLQPSLTFIPSHLSTSLWIILCRLDVKPAQGHWQPNPLLLCGASERATTYLSKCVHHRLRDRSILQVSHPMLPHACVLWRIHTTTSWLWVICFDIYAEITSWPHNYE